VLENRFQKEISILIRMLPLQYSFQSTSMIRKSISNQF